MDGHGDTVTAPQLIRIDTVDLEGVCGAAVAHAAQLMAACANSACLPV